MWTQLKLQREQKKLKVDNHSVSVFFTGGMSVVSARPLSNDS